MGKPFEEILILKEYTNIDIIHHEDNEIVAMLTAGLRQFNVENLGYETS